MDQDNVIDINAKKFKIPKFGKYFWTLGIVILVVAFALNSWYIVGPDENGVVYTFGKITDVTEPGLHFKLPYPIQTVKKPAVTKVHRVEVGFRTDRGGAGNSPAKYQDVNEESHMVTGDLNIVSNEYIIQYKIKDPVLYLTKVENPDGTVKKAAEAAMREVVGSSKIDAVLTDGKVEVQNGAREKLQQILDTYECGIHVVAVQLQAVQPPDEVKPAFSAVVDAVETKNQKINKAKEYQNGKLPEAEGKAQQMLENAQGDKIQRVENAKGDVARFLALYEEYAKSKNVTRKRLYFEMVQQVLPDMKQIYIMDGSGDTVKYLPLEAVKGGKANE